MILLFVANSFYRYVRFEGAYISLLFEKYFLSSLNGVSVINPIINAMPQQALAMAQTRIFSMKLNPKNTATDITNTTAKVSKIFKEKKFFLNEIRRIISLIALDITEDSVSPIGAANAVY